MGEALKILGITNVGSWWAFRLILFDCTTRRLPNRYTLSAAACSFIWAVLTQHFEWILYAGIWVLPYVFIGSLSAMRGIGGGDIKLSMALGIVAAAHAGAQGVFVASICSSCLSIVLGLILRFLHSKRCNSTKYSNLPHGPSMIIATWFVVVWSQITPT
ncbi:prepilin peptidase [Corynebacterium diphtheriae]|nr:prepilin peptidase [Corynebacterium diphtheriae]